MKRLAVALACVSAIALAACGNDGRLEVTPPASSSPFPTADNPVPTATSIPADE